MCVRLSDPSREKERGKKNMLGRYEEDPPGDPRAAFLNAFSHIFAAGYAAGYFACTWAEVLSADRRLRRLRAFEEGCARQARRSWVVEDSRYSI